MKRKVTLKDVAKAAGVHVSTVSRALDVRNRHLIASDQADRIRKISKKIGYTQNAAAVALRTSRTKMIGVVVPDITNTIFPPMIRGLEDALGKHGYLPIIGNTDNDPKREAELLLMLRERGVDGFVLASVELNDDVVAKLVADKVAIVTINRRVKDPSVSSVVHDENEGVRRVLTHLASLGHTHIATIAGPQRFSTGADRYQAFRKHRAAMNLHVSPQLVAFANKYDEAEGERCVEELLAAGQKFTAIACANDRLAIGAIEAMSRRGLDCPLDISVTGYNDMPMADRLRPSLTTIRVSQYESGLQAGELLHEMLDADTGTAKHLVLPVELIIRNSTKAIALTQ